MFVEGELSQRSHMEQPLIAGLESFDVFFRRESRRLIGLAYALSGSRLAADDIAQEALLVAYRKWDEVGGSTVPLRGLGVLLPTVRCRR